MQSINADSNNEQHGFQQHQTLLLIAFNIAFNSHNKAFSRSLSVSQQSAFFSPSASFVQGAIKGLLEKDFVTETDGTYELYDKFFGEWLKRN